MSQVSVISCSKYDLSEVKEALRKAINLVLDGDLDKIIKEGDKVLLKVNLLMGKPPSEAVTTHPTVVQAMIELVQEVGGKPLIGDSPGGGRMNTPTSYERMMSIAGYRDVADETSAEIVYFDEDYEEVPFPEGRITKRFIIAKAVLEADVIINLPKLKTHGFTRLTGAVKNMFGAIPGFRKAEYHLRMSNVEVFSGMLVDLYTLTNPTLNVMDAIVGMEGDGPSAGDPRAIGAILVSEDGIALDSVAAEIVGLPPLSIPTNKRGFEWGLSAESPEKIKVLGNGEMRIDNFRYPLREGDWTKSLPSFLRSWLKNSVVVKPYIDKDKCRGCQICVKNCPPKAMKMIGETPSIDYNVCIKCYCCHELCPHRAIELREGWLSRVLRGAMGVR